MSTRLIVFLFSLPWLLPGGARAAGHWQLEPTLTLSLRHDDNPFLETFDLEPASNLGIEPSLRLLRRTSRSMLSLHVGQTAERYARHPEIDTLDARQTLALGGDLHISRRWTAGLALSQLRTAAAGELPGGSHLQLDLGRRAARRRQWATTTAYALSRTRTVSGELTVTGDAVVGAAALSSTVAGLRFDHLRPHDSRMSMLYQYRRYAFDGGRAVSHRLGWGFERPVGRALQLAAEGGPRLGRAGLGLEWTIRAGLRTRRSELRGEWTDGESAVTGALAPALVRRATVSGATSTRAFHARATFDRLRSRGGLEATILRASFEAGYRLTPRFSITSLVTRTRQQDDLFESRRGRVPRTVLELRLVVTPAASRQERHIDG